MIDRLLVTTGIDLKNGAGISEITKYQDHLHEYKIVVYSGLNCESIMYQRHVDFDKRINLLIDEVTQQYHVISNLKGAMAKRYVCEECDKCKNGVAHTSEKTCSDCMLRPLCISTRPRFSCDLWNRHFTSQTCFDNHKKKTQ